MIKEVKVLSYGELCVKFLSEEFPHEWRRPLNSVFISILPPNEGINRIFPEPKPYALPLYFVDEDPTRLYSSVNRAKLISESFNSQQAEQIVSHVDRWHRLKTPLTLYVNCLAGISRSGAVGSWAVDYLGLDYQSFIKEHSWVAPNSHVRSLLNREVMKRSGIAYEL